MMTNNLNIRVYGTKKSLEWHQEHPNELIVKDARAPREIYRRGNDYITGAAADCTRIPFGHPEGFIEAFANIYRNFSYSVNNYHNSKSDNPLFDYPTVEEGYRGMKFIDAVIESSKSSIWIKI